HRAVSDEHNASEGEILAARTSPPLLELLQTMDKVSENLFAELILREVGRAARHDGTRKNGLAELSDFLTGIGASSADARLEDGSGLSRNSLVTPRLIAQLLVYMNGSAFRDAWISLLPAGGRDGTLENRLCCFREGHGVRAKTGSLSRALALSGYADSKTHGRLAFSILVDDFSAPAAEVRQWIDRIAMGLTE
ncbi:MAG: D-alanyl-D-alanine carboxypeptidase/D-alanyl-D-alanine endopeptidase, partial [Bryobacteraceae bacterium]